jgi:hypothetical protein
MQEISTRADSSKNTDPGLRQATRDQFVIGAFKD